MAQKPLFKAGVNKPPRRKQAASKHGKASSQTKRGKKRMRAGGGPERGETTLAQPSHLPPSLGTLVRPPKQQAVRDAVAEDVALTATINARNEAKAAAAATAAPGGRFTVVKAPEGGGGGKKGSAPKGAPKGV